MNGKRKSSNPYKDLLLSITSNIEDHVNIVNAYLRIIDYYVHENE